MNTRQSQTTRQRDTEGLEAASPEKERWRRITYAASGYWKSFEIELTTERGTLANRLDMLLDTYIQQALELLEQEKGARMKLQSVAYTAVHYGADGVCVIGTIIATPLPGEHPSASPKRARQR